MPGRPTHRHPQPTLGWSATVRLEAGGPVAYLSRPGYAAATSDLSELRAWARRWPDRYTDAVERFEALLEQTGRPVTWNLPAATVDQANAVIHHLNHDRKESA
jgi:hypothetical protein